MNKLRLDYFLNLGLKLVEGDIRDGEFKSHDHLKQGSDYSECKSIIGSFVPRKNTGVEPPNNIPVLILQDDGRWTEWNTNNLYFGLDNESPIEEWKPDLQELIKMQDKHDNNPAEDVRITNMADIKPVYTKAMKDAGELPSVGMEVLDSDGDKCEFLGGYRLEAWLVACKEGDADYSTHCDLLSKLKPIDTRTPEQKQVDEVVSALDKSHCFGLEEMAELLQKSGLLAEIKN